MLSSLSLADEQNMSKEVSGLCSPMTYKFNKIERKPIYLFYGPQRMDVHWLYIMK